MWSGCFRCYLLLLLPWWRCGVGTRGQEDFLSFLQDATKEPEKFELSESDEIKAMWIYGWFRLVLEKPFMHFSHDVWTIFRSKVVDLMWLRLIVSWQMLTETDRCWQYILESVGSLWLGMSSLCPTRLLSTNWLIDWRSWQSLHQRLVDWRPHV